LALLQIIAQLYPDAFDLKPPPYEYEFKKQPLDLIIGSKSIRKAVLNGENILELEQTWQNDLKEYDELRRSCFLY
jgi:uncharacterized protein YbbC (DUF1343 family)